jgi:hypothetical protein
MLTASAPRNTALDDLGERFELVGHRRLGRQEPLDQAVAPDFAESVIERCKPST